MKEELTALLKNAEIGQRTTCCALHRARSRNSGTETIRNFMRIDSRAWKNYRPCTRISAPMVFCRVPANCPDEVLGQTGRDWAYVKQEEETSTNMCWPKYAASDALFQQLFAAIPNPSSLG